MTYIPILSFLLSLLATWHGTKYSPVANIYSGLASCLSIVIYYHSRIYGHAFWSLVNIFFSYRAYFNWQLNSIQVTNRRTFVHLVAMIFLSIIVLGCLLSYGLASSDPWLDALTTVIGITALILYSNSHVESWLIWMAHDLLGFFLNMRAHFWLFAVKKLIYIFMGFKGYMEWSTKAQLRKSR